MAKRILISKAFDDGNKKLFASGKPTYKNLHSITKEIGEELGIPQKNVFYRIKFWETGITHFRKDSVEMLDMFFRLLCLDKEEYIEEDH